MRVVIHQTKKGPAYYIIRDVTKSNGTRSTETLRDLGTEEEIKAKYQCEDAYAWAQEQAREMEAEMPGSNVLVMLNPGAVIPQDQINCFETGYLFLQQVYYDLRIDLICRHIMKSYSFEYDLNDIMMKLVYERILHPSSKLSTCVQAQNLLEVPNFEYHDVPRSRWGSGPPPSTSGRHPDAVSMSVTSMCCPDPPRPQASPLAARRPSAM